LLANLLWAISWNRADGTFTTLHDAIYENVFLPIASPVNASLLFAIAFVLMMYAVAWGMWKKRLFIKI
jgi:predicted acyltransferase